MCLRESFFELQCECFIVFKAAIVHGENLPDATNSLLCRTGESADEFIRLELLQFSDCVNPQEDKRFASGLIILENDVKRCINRNLRSSQLADRLARS